MNLIHLCIAALIASCFVSGSQHGDTVTAENASENGEDASFVTEERIALEEESNDSGITEPHGGMFSGESEKRSTKELAELDKLEEEMEQDIITLLKVPHNLMGDETTEEKTDISVPSSTTEETSIMTAVSGGDEEIPRVVTFRADNTKIRRCIYGCDTVTLSETGTVTSTSVITIIPVTVPCSLVICPPCGCTTRILAVTGCPVITTTTPSDSTLTVTGDVTITFITVTETITDCSITTCPSQTTVTITELPSRTTITQFSTEQIFVTPTTTTSSSTCIPPGPPIVTIDPGCPCGYNEDPVEEEPEELEQCGCDIAVTKTVTCNCPNLHYFKAAAPSSPNVNIFKAEKSEQKKMAKKNKSCKPCTAGQQFVIQGTSVTVTSTVPLAPTTRTIAGEVCSTFIVCNPKNFICPASTQVTNAKLFASFIASKESSDSIPSMRDSTHPVAADSYVGFDGKDHPVAYNSPFVPENNGEVKGERLMEKESEKSSGHHHSGEAQRSDAKGQKILTPENAVSNKDGKDNGKLGAATVKNGCRSLHAPIPLVFILFAFFLSI